MNNLMSLNDWMHTWQIDCQNGQMDNSLKLNNAFKNKFWNILILITNHDVQDIFSDETFHSEKIYMFLFVHNN